MNALVIALLLAAPAQEYSLTFSVTPGKSLEKDYEHAFELGPHSREPFVREERRTVLTDRYVEVEGGRVVEFVRRFDRVRLEGRGDSPLQAESVRFTLDPEAGVHLAAFVEPESAAQRGADADSLAALRVDADGTGFLPDGPVALGDAWRVPAEAVLGVLTPGGTYVYRLAEPRGRDARGPELMPGSSERLAANIDQPGLRARLKEVTLLGADRIAVVALEGELLFEVDFLGPVHIIPREMGWFQGFSPMIPRRALLRYDFEGTLRWNIDSHHMDELQLEADLTLQENRTSMEAAIEAVQEAFQLYPYLRGSKWNEAYELDLDLWYPDGSLPEGKLKVSARVFC